MKYIFDGKRGFNHEPYWRYLQSVRAKMPSHLWEFAASPENHDLASPNSLHDSWLEYWKISEVSERENRRSRRLDIDACLLGPRHDRYIHLSYKDVDRHTTTPSRYSVYGDLLVHEMIIEGDGRYAHELVFAGGAVFTVHFRDFEHRIELLSAQ